MNVNRFFEVFKNFNHTTLDNLGVLCMNIYNTYPLAYKIYFDKNKKLTYTLDTKHFDSVKFKIPDIDIRKFIENLISMSNKSEHVQTFCTAWSEYVVCGTRLQFILSENISSVDLDNTKPYVRVFCNPEQIEEVFELLKDSFQIAEKNTIYSFGIATTNGSYINDKFYDYPYKEINIEDNYNDDFKVPYEKICEIIETENETGLILLYGEPGTGKSSVIKNLIYNYPNTKFVFIDGSVLASATQTSLISYFLDNENTVFILEDCEKCLVSRDIDFNPIINTLLNITDGIIGDVLGIKLICTFNTSLNNIDKALLRKGRLSMKYEFKKLNKDKVSKILGREIDKDMTLADIYNINEENDFSKKSTKVGF